MFDCGLLAFDDNGGVLLSDRMPPEDRASFVIPDRLRRNPTPTERDLFRDHRAPIFARG
jgi:hypothetical protein